MLKNERIELIRTCAQCTPFSEENKFLLYFHQKPLSQLFMSENSWDILILLGDKGSGKTTEIQHFANKNNQFYIGLDEYYQNLEKIPQDKTYAFFDSIDEFELSVEKNKYEAFTSILKKIKDNIPPKCKIVFTVRECDFSEEKLKAIKRIFTYNDTKKSEVQDYSQNEKTETTTQIEQKISKIEIYKLLPLAPNAISILCKEYAPQIAEKFLKEFKNTSTHEEFLETPVECIDTIKFFHRYQKLPQRSFKDFTNFFQHKLYFRYREINRDNPNTLSLQKIKHLSQRVAATNSLTNKPSIIKKENYNTQKENFQNNSDISMWDIFPDEDEKTISHYINSTLFSSNGENRVKFYNETIRHHLVYLWLKDRLYKQTYKKLKPIIFQTTGRYISPRKSLIIPIIMLSAEEYRIKKILIKQHPDLLLRFAHYANLNFNDKEQIFNNLMDNYKYRLFDCHPNDAENRMGLKAFADANLLNKYIERFASCDYSGQYVLLHLINALEKEHLQNENINEFLWGVFEKEKPDSSIHFLALKALSKQETNFEKIAEKFKTDNNLIDELSLKLLITTLYPKYLSLSNIAALLNSIQKDERRISAWYILEIIKDFATTQLNNTSLLEFLNELKTCDKEQSHVLKIYITLQTLYLTNYPTLSLNIINYLADLQHFLIKKCHQLHEINIKEELDNLKNQLNPSLIIPLFDTVINVFNKPFDKMLLYNSQQWLINIDLTIPDVRDYFLSLSQNKQLSTEEQIEILRFNIFQLREMPLEDMIKVIEPYCTDPAKKRLLENIKNPPEHIETYKDKKWREEIEQEKKEHQKIKEENIKYITDHIELIKNGDEKIFNVLLHISLEYHGQELADINLEKIETEFGQEITNAYVSGLKQYWQKCDINLNTYLNQEENKILNQTVVALPGIKLLSADNDFSFTKDMAPKAIYFGVQELNKFPDWFDDIIIKFPSESLEILSPIMEHVLKTSTGTYGFFNKIQLLKTDTLSIISNPLWNLIKTNIKQTKDSVLQEALRCLINCDTDKNEIIKLILSKIKKSPLENRADWFVLLFEYDINKFISQLEKMDKLSTIEDTFLKIFSALYDHGLIMEKRTKKITSVYELVKLIPIVFKYVHPKDDREIIGRSYSPTERDNAQGLRRYLWSLIDQLAKTRQDQEQLINLVEKINDPWFQDDLRRKADATLYNDTSSKAFNPEDIILMENGDFILPDNSSDLFNIVCDTLEYVKENIEKGDHSIRELYSELVNEKDTKNKKLINEKLFQKYILMELRAESKNLYSAVREVEVDDSKKPDLQIWERNFCTTIECKIATSWTYNELKQAIAKQLVDKYLKHSMYEYGILLLFNTKPKKTWSKKRLNFQKVIDELQKLADVQYKRYNHIKQIKVIGIEVYSKTNSTQKQTTKQKAITKKGGKY